MRLYLLLITMTAGLACAAQGNPQGYSPDARKYDAMFLEAVCMQEKGQNDAAFDLFRHCAEMDSTRSEAFFYLFRYYMALKQKERAMDCITRAERLEPTNPTYLEILGNMYISQRRYDLAADQLERLYSLSHDRTDVLGMLVQLYEEQNNYDKAISTLARLEVAEGKSERLSIAKSKLQTAQGNHKAAIGEMKQLADQYPNDLTYRCLYAATLYENGQQKKALAIYNDVLRQEPENRNALMALMAHYSEQNDTVKRNAVMERILMSNSITSQDQTAILRQMITESEMQQGGDSTRVLNMFRRMLDRPQADADVAMLCATYMNLKNMPHEEVTPVLEQVLKIQPDYTAARLQLVSYAWQDGDRERVISLCNDARQYTPDEMAFYYYQGIAYYQEEQLDNALSTLQNGISVINDDSNPEIVSDFYAIMGDILHQKGMQQEAFAAYDSCLVWKDDNVGCLNNYAYYLSETGQQLEKAENMSYKTIKAEPKNATYLDTYAWILFMQERYNEARIYIDQTLQCDSDSSAVLLEHAGDIYYHTGDTEKALALWQQALDRATEQSEVKGDRKQVLIRKIKLKKYVKE